MKFRGTLALSILLLASAALADDPVARILCTERSTDSWRLITMRTDVFPNYRTPMLDLKNEQGEALHGLSEPIPVTSNGMDMSIFFIASPFQNPPVLYKSDMSIAKRGGVGVRMASIIPASGNLAAALSKGEFKANRLAYSPKGLLAYPTDSAAYTVLDTKNGKSIQLKMESAEAANPQFSPDEQWLSLEFLNKKTMTVSTKIYSLNSSKVISLPTPTKGISQVAVSFAGKDYVTWTEAAMVSSPNDYVMTLRGGRLDQLNEKGQAKTLLTDKNALLKPVRIYTDSEGQFFSLITKEAYSQTGNSNGLGRDWVLTRGEAFISRFDKNLNALSQESISYHPRMIGMVKRAAAFGGGTILSQQTFFAPADQMILSLGDAGGVASLNIKAKSWNFHGSSDSIYRCYNPALGPEVAE